MPRFIGTEKEMEALAAFIVKELNGKETSFPLIDDKITKFKTEIPEFKPSDDYILLAWNTLGMKCASDADKWFSFFHQGII
jgi:hypothetical protein